MDSSSIYTQCSNAARRLQTGEAPFTEDDVVREAAASGGWGDDEAKYSVAEQHAPQVLAAKFRSRILVRFGIISPDAAGPPRHAEGQRIVYGGPLTGEPDYVRREGHILYGAAEHWEGKPLSTPNGEFDPVEYGPRHDPLFKIGRRKTSTRDDFRAWSEQRPTVAEPRPNEALLRRENMKLAAALQQAEAQVDELRKEMQMLRDELHGVSFRRTPRKPAAAAS
jgi:hypothetical protein